MLVYRPKKPSSLSLTGAWLKPTASLAVWGKKMGGDPHIGQPVCWGCSRESLFLRSNGIHPNLLVTHERLLYVDHVRYVWSGAIHRSSVESMLRAHRVFLVRCTSIQIAVTLGYE
jgi:hypothetical protein